MPGLQQQVDQRQTSGRSFYLVPRRKQQLKHTTKARGIIFPAPYVFAFFHGAKQKILCSLIQLGNEDGCLITENTGPQQSFIAQFRPMQQGDPKKWEARAAIRQTHRRTKINAVLLRRFNKSRRWKALCQHFPLLLLTAFT